MKPRHLFPLASIVLFSGLLLNQSARAGDFIEKTIGYRKDGSPILLTVYQSGKSRKNSLNREAPTTTFASRSYGFYESYPFGYAPLIRRPVIIHRPLRPKSTVRHRPTSTSHPRTFRSSDFSRRSATIRSKPAGQRR
ncbi:MAG: hypothetical protein AAF514_07890 [Verrucomicrobiota bacterium]